MTQKLTRFYSFYQWFLDLGNAIEKYMIGFLLKELAPICLDFFESYGDIDTIRIAIFSDHHSKFHASIPNCSKENIKKLFY